MTARILIVKTSSLGDIIHAFPVIDYLKHCYPEALIDWVVEKPFAELLRAHPMIHQVLCVDTKKWRRQFFAKSTRFEVADFFRELRKVSYDIVLDLQGNTKSALATKAAISPLKVGFAKETVPEWPNILATNLRFNPPEGKNIREDYLFLAQSAIGEFTPMHDSSVQLAIKPQEESHIQSICHRMQGKFKVLVCPGSNWANKQLSQETLLSFLQCFKGKMAAHFVVIWGNAAEKELANELSKSLGGDQCTVIDRLSLPALQNLMSHMDLVLAMDSLPLHLAGTTATPSYSIFGASSSHKYKPLGPQHHAFQGSCPYGQSFIKRCDVLRTCKTGACIKDLEGRQLLSDFQEWWFTHKNSFKSIL